MISPIVIEARNAHDLRAKLGELDDVPRVRETLLPVPLVAVIKQPLECAVFYDQPGDDFDPLLNLDQSCNWLMQTDVALSALGDALANQLPQQLLAVGQTVVLTFVPVDGRVDLSISYSGRDVYEAILTVDAIAFSWALQRVAFYAGLEIGHMFINVAQARLPVGVMPEQGNDPYLQGIRPFELDHVDLIPQLATLIAEGPVVGFTNQSVKKVFGPLFSARAALLDSQNDMRFAEAGAHANACRAEDLSRAAILHIERSDPDA